MNSTEYQGESGHGAAAQYDPQGVLSSLLLGVAGHTVGKLAGGSKAGKFGRVLLGAAGVLSPFEASQPVAASQDHVSEVELQGFFEVLRKMGGKVKQLAGTAAPTVGAIAGVAEKIAMLQAEQPVAASQDHVSEVELQGFFEVLRKMGGKVKQLAGTAAPTVGAIAGVAEKIAMLQAEQPVAASQDHVSEVELQGFFEVLRKIASKDKARA